MGLLANEEGMDSPVRVITEPLRQLGEEWLRPVARGIMWHVEPIPDALFPPCIIPVELGIEAEANNVAWIH